MRNDVLEFDLEDLDPELEPLLEAEEDVKDREPSRPDIEDGAYYFFVDHSEFSDSEIRVGKVDLVEAYNQLQNPVEGYFEVFIGEDQLTIRQTTDRWPPHLEWQEHNASFDPVKVDGQTVKQLNDYLSDQGMYESL